MNERPAVHRVLCVCSYGSAHSQDLARRLKAEFQSHGSVRVEHLEGGITRGDSQAIRNADTVVFTGPVFQEEVDEMGLDHKKVLAFEAQHLTAPTPVVSFNNLVKLIRSKVQ